MNNTFKSTFTRTNQLYKMATDIDFGDCTEYQARELDDLFEDLALLKNQGNGILLKLIDMILDK